MANQEGKENKMVKKGNKKKAGIIAGSVVAAGLVVGGVTIGVISGTAKVTVKYETGVEGITFANNPIKKGGSVKDLPTPLRPGYKFLGWYLDAEGNVPADENTKFSKDTTLYAQWKANEYSVTLFDNVLNTHLDTATYKAAYSDSNMNTVNLPILANVYTQGSNLPLYTFKGWADETGTIVASVDQSINNITIPYNISLYGGSLYAVWEGSAVEVWFGETKRATPVELGKELTLNYGQTGESFDYWSLKDNKLPEEKWDRIGAPGASLKITSDMVVEKNGKLAVEFSANYYAGDEAQTEYRVADEVFANKEDAENAIAGRSANYDFDTWYLDEAYNTVADVNNLPSDVGRVVLYAKLTGKAVTINFDYGTAELRDGYEAKGSMSAHIGETILLPAYARSYMGNNVDFVAWEYDGNRISGIGGEWTVPLNVTSVTLRAIWGSSYNLLNFNLQGGLLESGKIGDDYNELKTYSMPNVTLSKLGYNFVGWSESPNAMPGDSDVIAKDGEYTLTQSQTTLYAVWEPKAYEIKYNLVKGSLGAENPTNAYFGNEIKLANTPVREGYKFDHWEVKYIGSDTPSIIQNSGSLNIGTNVVDLATTEIEITAVWSPETYNFSIDTTLGVLSADDITIEWTNDAGVVVPVAYGEKVPYGSTVTLTKSALEKYNVKQYYDLIGIVPVYDNNGDYVTINNNDGAYGVPSQRKDFDNDKISFVVTGDSSYQFNYKPHEVTIEYSNGTSTASLKQKSYYGATSEHATSTINFGELFGSTVVDGKHFDYWRVTVNGTSYRFASLDSITTINSDSGKALPTLLYANNNINTLLPQDAEGNVTSLTLTVEAVYRDPVTLTLQFVGADGKTRYSVTRDITTRYGTSHAEKILLSSDDNYNNAFRTMEKTGYTFVGWEYEGVVYDASNVDVFNYEYTNTGDYSNIVINLNPKFEAIEYKLAFIGQGSKVLNENTYTTTIEQVTYVSEYNIDTTMPGYSFKGWSYKAKTDDTIVVGDASFATYDILNGATAIGHLSDWKQDRTIYVYAIYEEVVENYKYVEFIANDIDNNNGSTKVA